MSDEGPSNAGGGHLKKTLGPVMLWGLGVGYVISGEYFGWNLGLPLGGTYGMLAATALATIMYLTFIFSYTELACALPRAGGAFVYCRRALGPMWGGVAGIVQVVEFVFAPPAIAMAIGAYITQRFGAMDVRVIAVAAYLVFTGLNAWGVRSAAVFELAVTIAAVVGLVVFAAVTAPVFSVESFTKDPLPNGWGGAFACLPFAIWFYLGIEGVANAAEEAHHPQRNVAIGFAAAIITLVALALLTFALACGAAGWHAIVYPLGSTEVSDAPLPLAMAKVVEAGSVLHDVIVGIGLLGLIASFHGILLAAGRATMELGRSGYAPARLGDVHRTRGTPIIALGVNMVVGVVAIFSGRTGEIITLACFGALSLYVLSMIALLRLRATEPELPRPFRAVAYPIFPVVALITAALSLAALCWTNPGIAAMFAGLVAVGLAYVTLFAGKRARAELLGAPADD